MVHLLSLGHFEHGLSIVNTFGVNFEVFVQMTYLGELLSTKVTFESLFACVNGEMLVQITFQGKFLFAKITLKSLFSIMNF